MLRQGKGGYGDVDADLKDRLAIRELIESWVVWRDAGDWDRFRTVWFDDGRMMATWTQGTADEFIAMSKAGWERGVRIHFLEQRDGRWSLVLRQPIYEQDRMDPVDPAARLELDRELLEGLPEGYRHLAYLQTRIGYEVKRDMPALRGPEVEALYRSGAAWLAGEPLDR